MTNTEGRDTMNETKHMSERDQRILERYAEGATLDAIGREEGITRERVRQIAQQLGGPGAQTARAARQAVKEASATQARESFLEAFGPLASDLAHQGFTRPATIARIKNLFPAINTDLAEDALKMSSIVFDQDNSADTFSNIALEAGVWYLLGAELRLKPDHAWAAANLPQELLDELGSHLVEASVTADELATILGIIGAAQRTALEDPTLTITGSRYNELRAELLEAMGLKSAKGAKPWPPTRQTIMKRYEGWNDALESMGLALATKGRQKGLLIFSEEGYAQAIVDFISAASVSSIEPTFASYGQWVKSESVLGIRRPSPAAIRNYYGGWLTALRKAPRLVPTFALESPADTPNTLAENETRTTCQTA
ncbi:sigma factor-like helix-turn-helix DNA-binding protein [Microbacterium sp. C448]|uniref:sigma factor-like helix-turn-helix DNA-binding protein n=1 Tax=Microbacterium sp. C448 TaxID=1177594 RepID=UPI0011824F73|nr:sigma factor-like helix-turn-helix DNA-binding protein [Microbacterium sp. C448]